MAESIFARVSRLLSATVEDAVDRMEQAGGDAVMREAIREADRAIDQVKAEREATMARRLQATRQQKMFSERVEELTTKAKFALNEGREDLAEAALSRQIDFEAQAKKLDAVQAQAREEEQRLDDGLAALNARKRQMEDALEAYTISRREASLGGDGPTRPNRSAEKKVDATEQAFDRAMTGAGGLGFARADAETINRVAEIDGMQKAPPSPSGWRR
jgi:phage shock protein A